MNGSPIVYFVFNRPDHTRTTFEAIRRRRPERLFVVADGPRPGHPTDAARCEEVRRIVDRVDWPCEVLRDYSTANMGCKRRVGSGLDWAFASAERAIVLEDDCLPHPDFFPYCDALLDRHERDDRVFMITGDNFQEGRIRGDGSYYFSKYPHIWGWATWRRAWRHYQADIPFWPTWVRSEAWRRVHPARSERRHWERVMSTAFRGEIDTWDFSWMACVWYAGGLVATPNANLVTNIGFGADATHTRDAKDVLAERPVAPLGVVRHPTDLRADPSADRFVYDRYYARGWRRWRGKLLAALPRVEALLERRRA